MFAYELPKEIKPPLKCSNKKTKESVFLGCFFASLHSICVWLSERIDCGVQSHCLRAQMHIQSCVLCSLNSVNPSAVPNLRTQPSPVFSTLSRIFTLSHRASSQRNFHQNHPLPSFLSVFSCWLLLSWTKPIQEYSFLQLRSYFVKGFSATQLG